MGDAARSAPVLKGQSWSIGMNKDAQTVANFLKFYNPSIVGGSLGSHIGEVSQKEKIQIDSYHAMI